MSGIAVQLPVAVSDTDGIATTKTIVETLKQNLKTLILPSKSFEISSTIGATILQGPHQGAQKSTKTGRSLCKTSLSNEESVTAGADDIIYIFL